MARIQCNIQSDALGSAATIEVILPEPLRKSYPVLYLLHGLLDDQLHADRRSQMVDDVAFAGQPVQHHLVCDRLDGEAKAGIAGQVLDVGKRPCRQVIDHRHRVAARQQRFSQMRTDEAGAAGDECVGHRR